MTFRCARCHHQFSAPEGADEGELACPNCKAEAGLEPVQGIPFPMKLFGMIVVGVVVLAVGGGLLSRVVG